MSGLGLRQAANTILVVGVILILTIAIASGIDFVLGGWTTGPSIQPPL